MDDLGNFVLFIVVIVMIPIWVPIAFVILCLGFFVVMPIWFIIEERVIGRRQKILTPVGT